MSNCPLISHLWCPKPLKCPFSSSRWRYVFDWWTIRYRIINHSTKQRGSIVTHVAHKVHNIQFIKIMKKGREGIYVHKNKYIRAIRCEWRGSKTSFWVIWEYVAIYLIFFFIEIAQRVKNVRNEDTCADAHLLLLNLGVKSNQM